uniref:Uncharacterized protein n=1 Tax=Candidatus Kentrum sp. SD TaxID=2126332 RepID=A0A450Y5W4_9GAMM|nr:MAG: hypothetical protein BECKSD772F_GA0070984_100717 [Candidatus Kentron sp. SD]VFK40532.1 MAG: hypothetical protein BECKSD772E_GA0070983_100716 [Candidatus Kentron sp. SD]
MILARVDFPEPDNPVKNKVIPWRLRGGWTARKASRTWGQVNQSGRFSLRDKRSATSRADNPRHSSPVSSASIQSINRFCRGA